MTVTDFIWAFTMGALVTESAVSSLGLVVSAVRDHVTVDRYYRIR